MILELRGLHVFGYHGVEEEEKRLGQLFLFDLELEVGERGADDRLESAIDYTQVASAVRELSNTRRFDLLEALATAVADLLFEQFAPERVQVRVRKPQVKPGRHDGGVQRRHRRTAMTVAYVGLGSNLGDREAMIRRGRRADRRVAAVAAP